MSTIEVIALRSFPWSENGYSTINAVEKTTFMLPEKLFDGLNKIGYVRRAKIGDGHIELAPKAEEDPGQEPAAPAPDVDSVAVTTDELGGVSAKAPQPPVRTAELSADEQADLASGAWKSWKFFKARSVAAKVSEQPINNSADATAAIETYMAKE